MEILEKLIEYLKKNKPIRYLLLISLIAFFIKFLLIILSIYVWSIFSILIPFINAFLYFLLGTGLGYLTLKEKQRILKVVYFILFGFIFLFNYFSVDIINYQTWGLSHSNKNNIELSKANTDIENFLISKTGSSGVIGYIKYSIIEGEKTEVKDIDDVSFANVIKLITRVVQELSIYLGIGKAGLISNIIWLIVALYFTKWGFESTENEIFKNKQKTMNTQTKNIAYNDRNFVKDIQIQVNNLLNENQREKAYKLSYNSFSKYREKNTVTRIELLSILSSVLCKGWNNETAIATLKKMKEHKLSNDYINDLDKAYIDEEIGKILVLERKYDEAKKIIYETMKNYSNKSKSYFDLAVIDYKKGDYNECLKNLKISVEKDDMLGALRLKNTKEFENLKNHPEYIKLMNNN